MLIPINGPSITGLKSNGKKLYENLAIAETIKFTGNKIYRKFSVIGI